MSMGRQIILLMTLALVSLACYSTAAPANDEPKQKNARMSLESKSNDFGMSKVGNPSDLAWQAWLSVDNRGASNSGSELDSGSLIRRITPKSVFIAPNLPACPEGYEEDILNRCVKDVTINKEAHFNFILDQLRAMFPNPGGDSQAQSSGQQAQSSSSSIPTGPLRLDLPISVDSIKKESAETNDHKSGEKIIPLSTTLSSTRFEDVDDQTNKPSIQDAIVTVYETEKITDEKNKELNDEKQFFLGSADTKVANGNDKSSSTTPEPVPVMVFIDETNSSVSDLVDYKIPELHDKFLNITDLDFKGIKSDNVNNNKPVKNQNNVEVTLSPNAEHLIMQTETSTFPSIENLTITSTISSPNEIFVNTENTTIEISTKETININIKEEISTTSIPTIIFINISEPFSTVTDSDNISQIILSTTSDSLEDVDFTQNYHDESDDFGTANEEDSEEATESDEILTHSEAGITVTIPPPRVQPLSTPTEVDKDTTGSTISSEVSINGDFIRETTLVDLNNDSIINVSKKPLTIENEMVTTNLPDVEKIVIMEKEQEVTSLPVEKTSVNLKVENNEKKHDEELKKVIHVTEIPEVDIINKQTLLPSIIDIKQQVLSTTERNFNPVVNIKETSFSGVIDRKSSSSTISPIIIFPNEASKEILISSKEIENSEIMEASSTNAAETILPQREYNQDTTLYNRKRTNPMHSEILENVEIKFLTTTPTNNVKNIYNYNLENIPNKSHNDRNRYPLIDNLPEIKSIHDQRFDLNHPSQPDKFVRFPSYEIPHNRPGYVRFPSEEANSIHTSDDFKERRHHRPHLQQNNRNSMKNSGTGVLKHQYTSGRRTNRQHSSQQRSRSDLNDKNRSSMLLQFWTEMPLMRDSSLYNHPTFSTVPISERQEGRSQISRRVNFYKEMSSHDKTRAFAISSPISD